MLCRCRSSDRVGFLVAVGGCDTRVTRQWEVVAMSTSAEQPQRGGSEDLVPLEELILDTPGAHPISSVDELLCDAFETDQELDEFLAFVAESRHADLA